MFTKKNKLAIFDLDGTLFDTRNINFKAYQQALSYFNIDLNYEYYCKECNGRKYNSFLPQLCGFNDDRIEKIHNLKKQFYPNFLKYAVKNEALFDIIDGLKNDYYIALVTTASKKNTEEILNYFHLHVFDLIITQENVKKPKPDPEGFLLAKNHFQIDEKHVIIFEDSSVGIEAAKKVTSHVYVVKGYS